MIEKLEVDLLYTESLNINIGIPQSRSLKIDVVLLDVTIKTISHQRDLRDAYSDRVLPS